MQSVATNAGSGAGPEHSSTMGAATRGGQPPDMQRLEDLVHAMAGGDHAALSNVYEQTAAQVFAIASRVLRSKEDAEEIVCDVYINVWQRANTYDSSRGSVMAWLAVMARNRAVDRLRQRRDALSLDDDRHGSLAAALVGEALGPEQVLAQFQSGSAVHRALQSLNAQRRYLLGLAFFQGLTHQAIADATGMPLGTVKSHLRRALAALQGQLTVGDHRLGEGEMHAARPGGVDAPIRAAGGALLMIRSEMPPQGLRIA
jgi:RNA polymerase sigma-70 factor (ECF subfamily)